MDLSYDLIKKDCACGKFHSCDIEGVFVFDGAISKISTLLDSYSKILLVADENTYSVAGDKVESALKDKVSSRVIFKGDKILIPNEDAIFTVNKNLLGEEIIVGIGSGVIQDLCKYVAFENKIPYVIVATAPSMDGYASTGAAMITGGMKVTYTAGVPKYIIAEPEILKNAPFDMIQAGYGDVIGKYSALNDWKLASLINGEYFCSYVYDKTLEAVNKVIEVAGGLAERDGESVKILMQALILVGVMMSFVGNSRPASGSEHHMAHYFEITGILDDKDYLPHGIDVGFSTIITAKVRQELLSRKWSFKRNIDKDFINGELERIYKSSSKSCIELQEKTKNYSLDRISKYVSLENEIKSILAEMPSPDVIDSLLKKVGLDVKDYYNLYGKEKIDNGVLYSKDLKDRYTVFWIYFFFNKRKDFDKNKIKVIAFDLDGTLTQHRQPVPEENINMLSSLKKKYKLLMVGAGQVKRIFNQMNRFPIDVIGNYGMQQGVYNETTNDIDLVKDMVVKTNKSLVSKKIEDLRKKYGYENFVGDGVEFHPSGCITFPLLGTKADKEDKIAFDPDRKKRRKFYLDVCNEFSDYEVFVGGSSSFDMSPKNLNKYSALDSYCKENNLLHENVLFVGDDFGFGGNDEAVYLSDFPFVEIDDYKTLTQKLKFLL